MRRLILGALTALTGAAIITTAGVSGQGRAMATRPAKAASIRRAS
jgi:hypothetical protein